MLTVEIGGNLLAAVGLAGLVVLTIQWWKFRSGRR